MTSNIKALPRSVTGFYEWVIPNFAGLPDGKLESPTFEVGGYCWRLLLIPAGGKAFSRVHVSVFLLYPDATTCPPGSSGEPAMPRHLYGDPGRTRLAGELLALLDDDTCTTSGLTVIVGGGNGGAARSHASGSGSGGGGGGSGAGSGVGAVAATSGGCLPRSFRLHRAVLAARCEYFCTLFSAGMADSAARDLPDADPDAFAILLRYMYGGEVPLCERAVQRAAVPLCDTLLFPEVKEALAKALVETANAETITGDLLWAVGHGQEEVLEELVAVYKRVVTHVDPAC